MFSIGDATISFMHEGEKIKELLAKAGKTQSDLARALEFTPTAVARYLKAETLGAAAWENAAQGLMKLGIDPRQIRPVAVHREKVAHELRALLNQFNTKQLNAIKQFLDASLEEQHVLKVVIADRLERSTRH